LTLWTRAAPTNATAMSASATAWSSMTTLVPRRTR
jgi:hypothetical protein